LLSGFCPPFAQSRSHKDVQMTSARRFG
jgi:hypothetical protein